jgi:hypothetical protein
MATGQSNTADKSDEKAVEPEQDFIEYLGDPENPAAGGTAFLSSHTIPKGDGLWKRAKVSVSKDLTWERDPMGPGIGQKGNRMLLATSDVPPEALAVLEKTPGFKRVSE